MSNNSSIATEKQPIPHGKGKEILPLVVADLQDRVDYGKKEYGEPLKANNGRDALVDAYQEALDLVMFLRQQIEERKPKDKKILVFWWEEHGRIEVEGSNCYDIVRVGQSGTAFQPASYWWAGLSLHKDANKNNPYIIIIDVDDIGPQMVIGNDNHQIVNVSAVLEFSKCICGGHIRESGICHKCKIYWHGLDDPDKREVFYNMLTRQGE